MNIKLREKTVYGSVLAYPDCEKSKIFSDLIEKKTFSNKDISMMRALEYNIEIREV